MTLCNSLPAEYFSLTDDLNGFKCKVTRYHYLGVLRSSFPICLSPFNSSSNSIPCSGCSTLFGVNPNKKKQSMIFLSFKQILLMMVVMMNLKKKSFSYENIELLNRVPFHSVDKVKKM